MPEIGSYYVDARLGHEACNSNELPRSRTAPSGPKTGFLDSSRDQGSTWPHRHGPAVHVLERSIHRHLVFGDRCAAPDRGGGAQWSRTSLTGEGRLSTVAGRRPPFPVTTCFLIDRGWQKLGWQGVTPAHASRLSRPMCTSTNG